MRPSIQRPGQYAIDPTEQDLLCAFVMLGRGISVARHPSSAVDPWYLIVKQVGVDGQHLATCDAIFSLYTEHDLVDSGMPIEDVLVTVDPSDPQPYRSYLPTLPPPPRCQP